jgi:hypothetical protein
VRLQRQRKMLAATCLLAVPRDANKELWSSCTEEVKRVCDTFGLSLRRAGAAFSLQHHEPRAVRKRAQRALNLTNLESELEEEEQQQQQVSLEDDVSRPKRAAAADVASSSEELQDAEAKKRRAAHDEQDVQHDVQQYSVGGGDGSSSVVPSVSAAESSETAVLEVGEDALVRQALARAREEVGELHALVQEQSGKTIEVGSLVAPDPAMATARDHRLLWACLSTDEHEEQAPLEQLGLLQRWWRLVRRCYAAVAIFDHLAASRSKQHTIPLYNEMARSMADSYCSYVHAKRLERLGRLVLQFPRLCYQTQFISLTAWFQIVPSTDRPLLDSLDGLLSARDAAFWALNVEVCQKCSGAAGVLWKCTECACWFHEACADYEAGLLSLPLQLHDGQVLDTRVWCGGCLVKGGLDHRHVARETREARIVAAFLNAPGCAFVLRRLQGDGTGWFRVLVDFATRLGWKKTFAVFCRRLATAALAATGDAGAGAEAKSVAELKRIEQSRNPARDLQNGAWADVGAWPVLRGFVRLFPTACVRRFAVSGDVLAECEVYGEGGESELCVLQWTEVLRFDELVRRLAGR